MTKKKPEPFEFEQGMQRLEEIIQQFDEGALSLDDMENHFVEGMELLDLCSGRLENVETRVTQLVQNQKDKWTEIAVEPVDSED